MKIISKENPDLNWLGRWIDNNGMYSGWGGSALKFKFTGTSLYLEMDICNSGGISAMIDDYSSDWTHRINIFQNGINIIPIATELENKEHTAFLRFWSNNYKNKRNGIDYLKIRNILIDDSATINEWKGNINIGVFGDSWASADNDYFRFLNVNNFDIHSISDPGFKISDGIKRYPYCVGKIRSKDIDYDGIVIGYGINDANSRYPKFNFLFKKNVLKLIDKIRVNSPSTKIFLLQSPNNEDSKVDTSRYGYVLSEITKECKNCIYISSKGVEKYLTWKDDKVHLDTNGKHIYGNWLGNILRNYF